jgi:hypothetical protein
MLSLFRRKTKPTPSRRRRPKSSAPATEPGRFEPPLLEGYAVREVRAIEVPHETRLARLTPEQLQRVLSANDKPVALGSTEERPRLPGPENSL